MRTLGFGGSQAATRRCFLEAHHTTHIEGAKLSLDESERLLAGEAVPGADLEDVRELLNYRDAFDFVSAWLGSGRPITEGLVQEIHRRLVDRVRGGFAAPGEYRRLWTRACSLEGEPSRRIQRGTTGRHPA